MKNKSALFFIIANLMIIVLPSCSNGSTAKEKNDPAPNYNRKLKTGWYYVSDQHKGCKRQLERDTENYFIDTVPIITPANMSDYELYEAGHGGTGLSVTLDEAGQAAWEVATGKSVGKYLAFILDDKLMMLAIIAGKDTGNILYMARHDFSKEDIEKIMKTLKEEK